MVLLHATVLLQVPSFVKVTSDELLRELHGAKGPIAFHFTGLGWGSGSVAAV